MLSTKTQRPVLLSWPIACLVLATGCDPFGADPPPVINAKPTVAQVGFCRKSMYIAPEAEITPLGYFYQQHFLDDEAAFKFSVPADSVSGIFQSDFIPANELVLRGSLGDLNGDRSPDWWDPNSKSLVGGDFTVPPPNSTGTRGLCVGIVDNKDGSYTVYVRWNET